MPTMLLLTLNPALFLIGTLASNLLYLTGIIGAIINTRISITFGLMALFFLKTDNYSRIQKTGLYAFGMFWFLLEMYCMYQGFRVVGAIQ